MNAHRTLRLNVTLTKGEIISIIRKYYDTNITVQALPFLGEGVTMSSNGATVEFSFTGPDRSDPPPRLIGHDAA